MELYQTQYTIDEYTNIKELIIEYEKIYICTVQCSYLIKTLSMLFIKVNK